MVRPPAEFVVGSSHSPTLVLGCNGMLGRASMRVFGPAAVGCDIGHFDISDRDAVLTVIRDSRPTLIVNCAAATDVDRCESDHGYADRANTLGPRFVAEAARSVGARLVHVSTDFVFDGAKGAPYTETDSPNPLGYYGSSKLEGERAVTAELSSALVVRTSWLYGAGPSNFPRKVLQWAADRDEISVAEDQFGSPTYADDLAEALHTLVSRGAEGLYHVAGSGCVSRFDLARTTLALAGRAARVVPVPASRFPLPAPRPASSCLDCSKAGLLGVVLPPWQDALARFMRAEKR